ncbi:MAG: hypothetical protein IT442_15945 [Phycisphaeraceae bacterium]|nr:hypothetical protein [Phycisphaeraceae bacterium]
MDIEHFLSHHGLSENPFDAEEARHDRVFEKLAGGATRHPDFAKILGQLEAPSTSVVFGEKGSGKTAIRLTVARQVREHNAQHPDAKTLVVAYDDLNPVLDRIMQNRLSAKALANPSDGDLLKALSSIRLQDHQDGLLARAVTRLVDGLSGATGDGDPPDLPTDALKRLRKLPRRSRADLAVLAALYDQPASGSALTRWESLRRSLRLGWINGLRLQGSVGAAGLVAGVILVGVWRLLSDSPIWMLLVGALLLAAGVILGALWAWRVTRLRWLARKILAEMTSATRRGSELRKMLGQLSPADLHGQPWPLAGNLDSRYQLTGRFLAVIEALGYKGMLVLVDRVDEPTSIQGRPDRMRAVVWPMLDNKFLQQQHIGIKLLLPIELRPLLLRESAEFYQEARLDKQNLVDRLGWSGVTLYDLCNGRLRACLRNPHAQIVLTNLFDTDVTAQYLIDALDKMHQPRDAFKFLYQVISEHCRSIPQDQPRFLIPRPIVESIQRIQAQRVQDLGRGLSPS